MVIKKGKDTIYQIPTLFSSAESRLLRKERIAGTTAIVGLAWLILHFPKDADQATQSARCSCSTTTWGIFLNGHSCLL